MLIYFINISLLGIYSLIYALFKNKYGESSTVKKSLFYCAIIQVYLLLALRNKLIGVDIQGYLGHFRRILYFNKQEFLEHGHEIGYKLLCKFIGLMTHDEQLFIAIMAALCIIPVGKMIYKHSKMPFLSLALFISFDYYSFIFSGIRQGIAYGLTMYSFTYIKEKKPFKFCLSVILAATFHKSALIFLPAYFLANLKPNKYILPIIILFDTFIFIFRVRVIQFFIKYFYDKYDVTLGTSYNWFMFCTLIVIFGMMFYKKVEEQDKSANNLYMMLITGVSIMVLASVGNNVMRVANYYFMFVILFIPEIIQVLKDKRLAVLGCYAITALSYLLYFYLLRIDGFHIVPYKFFWQLG